MLDRSGGNAESVYISTGHLPAAESITTLLAALAMPTVIPASRLPTYLPGELPADQDDGKARSGPKPAAAMRDSAA